MEYQVPVVARMSNGMLAVSNFDPKGANVLMTPELFEQMIKRYNDSIKEQG